MSISDKAVVTCALTGVLTNPQQHPVPVTVAEMAASAKEAFEAGASIFHVHFRSQEPGLGHLPSWDPDVAEAMIDAIRAACPGCIINMSTGVVGLDVSGPITCLKRVRPEIAACNAGTLNYLKAKRDGTWAWPPLVFDNPVSKVEQMALAMKETGTRPEWECFDVGIVRSVGPADARFLPLLRELTRADCRWQVTAIGREDVWPLHQAAAEQGGHLRTGLEDTFYLPDGSRARGNGDLVEALVRCTRNAGREVASPEEARELVL
jgi:uncharacterized protein (DUF849 family)